MRASTKTLLSLKEWADWFGFHPWHFAQISRQADGTLFPQRNSQESECHQASYQFERQDFDRLCREEIAIAIETAEKRFFEYAGFHPAPRYASEEILYPQNARRSTYAGWGNVRGEYRTIELKSKYVSAIGVETLTSLGTYAITRSDADGDGILERVSIGPIVVPSGTETSEICAFFTESDRLALPQDEFEIKPLYAAITGGTTLNIRGYSYCFVRPALQLSELAQPLPHDAPATYVEEVEVFRRTTDYSQAGTLQWKHGHCPNPPCTAAVSTPCFSIDSSIDGFVTPQPAAFDNATQEFIAAYPAIGWRAPDKVTCNFLSGYPRQRTGEMDTRVRDVICKMSAAFIPKKTSMCARADARLNEYRNPPKEGDRSPVSQRIFDASPMGNSKGELEAWAFFYTLPTRFGGVGQ